MTKSTGPTYYGRLGYDVDPEQMRETIAQGRLMLDHMERLMDDPLTFPEQALAELVLFWDKSQVMIAMPMLRPIFMSHLIGRLVADKVTFADIARKVGTTRQRITSMYYRGVNGADTEVPKRQPKKKPVTKKEAS